MELKAPVLIPLVLTVPVKVGETIFAFNASAVFTDVIFAFKLIRSDKLVVSNVLAANREGVT